MNIFESIQMRLTFGLNVEQEDRFRQNNFIADVAQARICVLLMIVPTSAFVVSDYVFFGLSWNFYGLLALRLMLIVYTILLLKKLQRFSDYLSYDRSILYWGLFFAVSIITINSTRPAAFVGHTVFTVLAIFVSSIAVPTRFTNQLIISLVLTIGELLVVVPNLWMSPQATITALFSIVFAEIIAFASGWQLNYLRRREFLTHEEVEKARTEAEMQLAERKYAEEALKKAHESLEEKVKERTVELEKAYVSLKESEKSLAEAQKIARIGNWEWNLAANEFYYSDELYRIFGLSPQKHDVSLDEVLTYIHPEDRDYVINCIMEALNGKVNDAIDFRIILDEGTERAIHTQSEIIFDEKKIPVRMRGTVQDVTESKRAEEKLRESEEKYRNIVETANEGIIIIDDKAIVTFANNKMTDMFGYDVEESIGRSLWNYVSEENRAIIEKNMEKWTHGIIDTYELKLTCKDGSSLWALINAKPLFDKNGKYVSVMSMLTDITKRKETEAALERIEIASRQEIHHRIKNNLQVISSLLDLQAEKFRGRNNIKDLEVREAFRESQDRVISMALIHEELYRSAGIEKINFSSYIGELTDNLFLTYRLREADIRLEIEMEDNLFFEMDTAVPLGIIVNELISNSLKHAFSNRDKGEIHIKLVRAENIECSIQGFSSTNFTLSVSDNGVGIPEDLEIEDLNSLGLQLVTALIDQLDGELEIKRNNGSEFIIRFKIMEKDNQGLTPTLEQLIE